MSNQERDLSKPPPLLHKRRVFKKNKMRLAKQVGNNKASSDECTSDNDYFSFFGCDHSSSDSEKENENAFPTDNIFITPNKDV